VSLKDEQPLLCRNGRGGREATIKDKNEEPGGEPNRRQPKSKSHRIHCPLAQNV
jgi:hypothetical protein